MADIIVFGSDVPNVFVRNQKVQTWLNMFNFRIMTVEPQARVGTAQFLGNLNRPYCAMYSYAEMAEQESFTGGPQ